MSKAREWPRGWQMALTDALHASRRINWVMIVFKVASLL